MHCWHCVALEASFSMCPLTPARCFLKHKPFSASVMGRGDCGLPAMLSQEVQRRDNGGGGLWKGCRGYHVQKHGLLGMIQWCPHIPACCHPPQVTPACSLAQPRWPQILFICLFLHNPATAQGSSQSLPAPASTTTMDTKAITAQAWSSAQRLSL